MCGIFGVIAKENCSYNNHTLKDVLIKLASFSEERGKDSSGIAFRNELNNKQVVIKGAIPISSLIASRAFKLPLTEVLRSSNGASHHKHVFAAIGHARLTTNGTQLKDINNQPVVKDGLTGIHNGIIVNVDDLWNRNKDLQRLYDIDTEVMLSLFRKYLTAYNDTKYAVVKTIKEVFGTVSTAIFIDDRDEFVLATNNGSLYTLTNNKDILLFASEYYILDRVLKESSLKRNGSEFSIKQLQPNTGKIIDLKEFKMQDFNFNYSLNGYSSRLRDVKFQIDVKNISEDKKQLSTIVDISSIAISPTAKTEKKLLEHNLNRISQLRRCKKCLLPETFPFIEFDKDGVCNVCNNYIKRNQPKPIEELEKLVEPYRKNNDEPDCIVPYSGGRDSTYTLHIVKNVLKLNPIAFTYDWGMVTDLGRRNIARVCGKLGVENIIVSADIHWKRANIKNNILAWLKNPSLGMIPLFMAGDKFFFYYTNRLKKQTGIKLNIWGANPLENTDFKVGFCGVPLRFNKERIYSLSMTDQTSLFGFVAKNILKSPSYINQSILDTLGSFASRYIAPKKDYYHMFDYYRWDEKEIEDLIINEYKWETAIDTNSTWRIGDGTSAFYNYIYYTVAGFSEYDTFRSNQIREGMLTREEGLELINRENFPRYESLKWYLEIIGLDFEPVIKAINKIPKLY